MKYLKQFGIIIAFPFVGELLHKLISLPIPATICLAVPLYEQFALLKNNYKAVIAGICAGVCPRNLAVMLP